MIRILLFNVLQVLASGYAFARGGGPERAMGAAMLAAAATTYLAGRELPYRFVSVEGGVLGVDAMLLLAMLLIALNADRWWTMWVVALQALGTGAHLARALDPHLDRTAYGIMISAWSYPMVLLLVIGTLRHDRRRKTSLNDFSRSGAGDVSC